jgi:hypothetical protein
MQKPITLNRESIAKLVMAGILTYAVFIVLPICYGKK